MTTTLSIEIGAARAYATAEGSAEGNAADLAETKVREYAGHYGTPERETTLRLATDAAEQAAEPAPTHCRHCGKPASRHYYGGWCTPAPDRIPSMSGGGICPPREVRTKYEAPVPRAAEVAK